MVEIIKRGEAQVTGRFVKCRNCLSEMFYDVSEGRQVDDARDGNAMVYDCPVCDKEIWMAA
jgi:hypothetical protein